MIRINRTKDKKGQAILEFSLFVVVTICAFIAIQGFVSRALQGRIRSSTDSVGEQFSAGYTNVSSVNILESTVVERSVPDHLIRTTYQHFSSTEHQVIDSYAAEYAGF